MGGLNENGQLGIGSTNNIGDEPNEMGKNLSFVDFGTDLKAKSLAAGTNHTCGILSDSDGSVKCFGGNNNGQLGQEDFLSRGTQPNEMGDNINQINLAFGTKSKKIACGSSFTCVLSSDDYYLKCFGSNHYGETGAGSIAPTIGGTQNEMGTNLAKVDLGKSDGKPNYIATGEHHVCTLLDSGFIKCFGRNHVGQLGYGDSKDRGSQKQDMGDNLKLLDIGSEVEGDDFAPLIASLFILMIGILACLHTKRVKKQNIENDEYEHGEQQKFESIESEQIPESTFNNESTALAKA